MEELTFRVHVLLFILLFAYKIRLSCPQLIVNVKTKSGRLTKQYILADPEKDIVTLDISYADGARTTALIDFPKNLQVLKTTVLGEMERGEKPIHVMCFVVKFFPNEFISSDAMSKLRQKNPDAIRIPEEMLQDEHIVMEKEIPLESAALFSGHVHQVCADADKIYTSEDIIKSITKGNKDLSTKLVSSITSIIGNDSTVSQCTNVMDKLNRCLCHYELCLSWYPCALKYCESLGEGGEKVSSRCGIKTCGKCRQFQFFVDQQEDCFWDTALLEEL